MTLTKLQMSKVIVQALYNYETLPPDNHFLVIKTAKKTKPHLSTFYKLALKILNDRITEKNI